MIKKTKYSNILNKEFKVFALFDSDTESTNTNTSQNKTKRYLLKISKQDRSEKGTLLALLMNPSNAEGYDTKKPSSARLADDTVINLINYSQYKTIYVINTMPYIGSNPEQYLESIKKSLNQKKLVVGTEKQNYKNTIEQDCAYNLEKIKNLVYDLDESNENFDLLLGGGRYMQSIPKKFSEEDKELFKLYRKIRGEQYDEIIKEISNQAEKVVVADLNKVENGKQYITGTHPLAVQRKMRGYRTHNKESKNHRAVFANLSNDESSRIKK